MNPGSRRLRWVKNVGCRVRSFAALFGFMPTHSARTMQIRIESGPGTRVVFTTEADPPSRFDATWRKPAVHFHCGASDGSMDGVGVGRETARVGHRAIAAGRFPSRAGPETRPAPRLAKTHHELRRKVGGEQAEPFIRWRLVKPGLRVSALPSASPSPPLPSPATLAPCARTRCRHR